MVFKKPSATIIPKIKTTIATIFRCKLFIIPVGYNGSNPIAIYVGTHINQSGSSKFTMANTIKTAAISHGVTCFMGV